MPIKWSGLRVIEAKDMAEEYVSQAIEPLEQALLVVEEAAKIPNLPDYMKDRINRLIEELKRMTGGEPLWCEHIFERGYKFQPTHKLWLSGNHEPVITDLVVSPEWVLISGSSHIELSAEDEDGDELSYEWVAEEGKIAGSGQTIDWTAPDSPGLYEITVIVNDGFGKETKRTISVSVSQYPPPVIEELVVTPETPKYFKEKGDGYMILRDRIAEINVVIDGMRGDLTYEWSDGGETYPLKFCNRSSPGRLLPVHLLSL